MNNDDFPYTRRPTMLLRTLLAGSRCFYDLIPQLEQCPIAIVDL